MIVRVTQLDGKLPNIALMRISSFHKKRGDDVVFTRHAMKDLFEPTYDVVYGSSIFKFSEAIVNRFKANFQNAIVGGTGVDFTTTTEQYIGGHDYMDWGIYPDYKFSMGMSMVGCRLRCSFCVVPKKEGNAMQNKTIKQIWRGEGHPKKICLLDNDFFGQSEKEWRARIDELNEGKFKVCFNQGLNVRLINRESAKALATVQYRDDQFTCRRLYTAWDNIGDEKIFFKGVGLLNDAGIPPKHLMAYMLIGFDKRETHELIMLRFKKMTDLGISPYPMVFDRDRRELKAFQRWVCTRLYKFVDFDDYRWGKKKVNRGWSINDE